MELLSHVTAACSGSALRSHLSPSLTSGLEMLRNFTVLSTLVCAALYCAEHFTALSILAALWWAVGLRFPPVYRGRAEAQLCPV